MPVHIDTDNALGSPMGDVDDAWAIAAAIGSDLEIGSIGCVFGNTSESRSFENTRRLLAAAGSSVPVLRGAPKAGEVTTETSTHLLSVDAPATTILALGPLTNLVRSAGRPWKEVIVVGSNVGSKGRWPPWYPHEFNLTHDREASRRVFASGAPLTLFPLDRIESLRISNRRLRDLHGPVGEMLRRGSRRWLLRTALVKLRLSFRVCDLVAAAYAIDPSPFEMIETKAVMSRNTHIRFGEGDRRVRVLKSFDSEAVWNLVSSLIGTRERDRILPRAKDPGRRE